MTTQKDRVAELSTDTGTGTLFLAGAPVGYRTFSAAYGAGGNSECYYGIVQDGSGEWEIGLGTFLGPSNALRRDLVLSSSNGGALTVFPPGDKMCYVTFPADSTLTLRARRATDVALKVLGSMGQTFAQIPNAAGDPDYPQGAVFGYDTLLAASGTIRIGADVNAFGHRNAIRSTLRGLDFECPLGVTHSFRINDVLVARIGPEGTALPLGISVVTKEKGDFHYPQLAAASNTFAGEIILAPANTAQLRFKDVAADASGIATLTYQNSTTFYLMLTNDGDANGTYNSLRPLYINKATGLVSMGNGLTLTGAAPLTLTTGVLSTGGELESTKTGIQIRLKPSTGATGYAALLYTDATAFHMMMTASGDADGTYSTLRPFNIAKATGVVGMNNGLTLASTAKLTLNGGGLLVGSATAATPADLSEHIALYSTTYGFSVTGARLNYVTHSTAAHVFLCGAAEPFSIKAALVEAVVPVSLTGPLHVAGNLTFDTHLYSDGLGAASIFDINIVNPSDASNMICRFGRSSPTGNFNIYVLNPGTTAARVQLRSEGTGKVISGVGSFGDYHIGANPAGTVDSGYLSSVTAAQFVLRSGLGTTGNLFLFRDSAATTVALVEPAGTAMGNNATLVTKQKGAATYAPISSLRFKETVLPHDEALLLEAFDNLDIRTWLWGGEIAATDERRGTPGLGFIAEEVDTYLPIAVTRLWIHDEDGNVPATGETQPHGLDAMALIAVLVAKIRQQEERLAHLEDLLAA